MSLYSDIFKGTFSSETSLINLEIFKLLLSSCMASVRLRKTIDLSLLFAALGVADETNP